MSKLPAIKRFTREDFPDAPNWIDKLFYTLNLFMSSVYSALNQGLTANDNTLGMIKTLSISGASPSTSFKWNFLSKPEGCIVIAAVQTDGTPATITNAVTCDWSYSQGIIYINNVTGLNASHTYSVTFWAIGG